MLNDSYDRLVSAARQNSPFGPQLLQQVGAMLYSANKDRMASIEDGVAAARRNLLAYIRFFPQEVADKVRAYYDLDAPVPAPGTRTPTK